MDRRILLVLDEIEWKTFFPTHAAARALPLELHQRAVDPTALPPETWAALLADYQPDILLGAWKCPPVPREYHTLTGGRLRYVCYLAGSVRHLITAAHLEQGLIVSNWGNTIARTVAECGLMLAIAALRRMSHWQRAMHDEGGWKTPETVTGSLFERKVGLHGFGAISQALVRLLQPFEVEISTYSPSVPDQLLAEFNVRRAATLEDLFTHNDVIIELAALTPKNTRCVTEAHLRMIPEGGVFVNVGRGKVVDEAALARVAAEGNIQVGLDVYGDEPLPLDSPFRGMRNVVLFPHLGGPTTDRRQDSGRLALQNIRAFLAGEALEAAISPTVYARAT